MKLTAKDLIKLFEEKPIFCRPESSKYGWSPTSGGLYSITDFYKYFEEKGYTSKDVDDVKYLFQTHSGKLEKGKTHYLQTIRVKNYNPEYSRSPYFLYYYYDISLEEANKLKEMYEKESKTSMVLQIEKQKARKLSVANTTKSNSKKPSKTLT